MFSNDKIIGQNHKSSIQFIKIYLGKNKTDHPLRDCPLRFNKLSQKNPNWASSPARGEWVDFCIIKPFIIRSPARRYFSERARQKAWPGAQFRFHLTTCFRISWELYHPQKCYDHQHQVVMIINYDFQNRRTRSLMRGGRGEIMLVALSFLVKHEVRLYQSNVEHVFHSLARRWNSHFNHGDTGVYDSKSVCQTFFEFFPRLETLFHHTNRKPAMTTSRCN